MTNNNERNETKANKSKTNRLSRLALNPDLVHSWLTECVNRDFGFTYDVKDFKKNNGLIDLLGDPQPIKK